MISHNAKTPYLFFRQEGFYVLELDGDESASDNAECNPGTVRVENAITEKTVWPIDKKDKND